MHPQLHSNSLQLQNIILSTSSLTIPSHNCFLPPFIMSQSWISLCLIRLHRYFFPFMYGKSWTLLYDITLHSLSTNSFLTCGVRWMHLRPQKKKYTLSSGCTNIHCVCGVSTIRGSTSMAVERWEEEVPTIGAWLLAHDFTRCDKTSETFLMCKSISRTYWSSGSSCWWCAENVLRLPGPEEHNNNSSFYGNRHINKEITNFSSESNCSWFFLKLENIVLRRTK